MKEAFVAPQVPPPAGPYSHAIVVNNQIFLSGQGPLDPLTNDLVGSSIQEQVRQTLANIERILNHGGFAKGDLVSVRVFLSTLEDFAGMNDAYGEFFGTIDSLPVRTTVQVGLPRGMLVEIDAMAVKVAGSRSRRS